MGMMDKKIAVFSGAGKRKIFVCAITLFTVFAFIRPSYAEEIPGFGGYELGGDEGWVLKKNKNGIKVWLRSVKCTPMRAFKGIGEIKGKIPNLVAFLMDIERYPEWMYPLTESFILSRISETEAYIYNVLKPPVVSARDGTVRRQWYYYPDTGTVIVTIKGITEYVPRRKKIVRGEMIIAYYKLVPTSDNTIEMTYECITDPGGILPVWLINFCVVYTPYSTIKQIRKYQPFEDYKGKTYDFMNARLLVENNQNNHSDPGANDYQEELEKQMREVTYGNLKRYYFDTHPYGALGQMKCYVWVEKGCPDMDVHIQTVDDYKWSDISTFKINGEKNKGKAVLIPSAELSRKSYTPGGMAFGINGIPYNNGNKLSGMVVTKLINSYMKRSGADILLKIEKGKDPYITYLSNETEMTQKEIQDEEFRLAMNKYDESENKLEKKDGKKKRWWFTWWLSDDGD